MAEELSKKDLLIEVNNAIHSILVGGQSYKIGSRTLTRANLTELKNMRAELETEISAEDNSSNLIEGAYVAFFDGR